MSFTAQLRRRAAALGRRLVLAEGWDERVARAARHLAEEQMAEASVLDRSCDGGEHHARIAEWLASRKPDRIGDRQQALELAAHPLYYAAGMVALGEADAAVAGAAHSTGDVLRAALWAIGPAPAISTVSSAFYMVTLAGTGDDWWGKADENVLTFTDCGVVPDPDPQQLAEIAVAASSDRAHIVGDDPRVAFLSFSTRGSAAGERVSRVTEAVDIFRGARPDIPCDGELQGDAALVPAVAERKAAGSPVAGRANVLVFPDLDSGNIAYKLVQRLAGARAIGPIIQGLARPMADLSRGATAEDIVDVAAVALLQSAGAA